MLVCCPSTPAPSTHLVQEGYLDAPLHHPTPFLSHTPSIASKFFSCAWVVARRCSWMPRSTCVANAASRAQEKLLPFLLPSVSIRLRCPFAPAKEISPAASLRLPRLFPPLFARPLRPSSSRFPLSFFTFISISLFLRRRRLRAPCGLRCSPQASSSSSSCLGLMWGFSTGGILAPFCQVHPRHPFSASALPRISLVWDGSTPIDTSLPLRSKYHPRKSLDDILITIGVLPTNDPEIPIRAIETSPWEIFVFLTKVNRDRSPGRSPGDFSVEASISLRPRYSLSPPHKTQGEGPGTGPPRSPGDRPLLEIP